MGVQQCLWAEKQCFQPQLREEKMMAKCSVHFYPCKDPTQGRGYGIYSGIISTHLNFKKQQLSSSEVKCRESWG